VGAGIAWLRRHLEQDPPVENTVSLLTPFAAYLPAEAAGVSGVLAVVTIGLYLGRRGTRIISSRTRLQAGAFWTMLTFLLNGLLFILTGLQLRQILHTKSLHWNLALLGAIGLILLAIILVRIVWVFVSTYLPRALRPRRRARDPSPPWQSALLVGWTGIRGGLSLVTALAIPYTLANGQPFPGRDLIICIAYAVILTTLLLQGLSLPWLIRRLQLPAEPDMAREEAKARLTAARAAVARLDKMAAAQKQAQADGSRSGEEAPEVDSDLLDDLRAHHVRRVRRYSARLKGRETDGDVADLEAYNDLKRDLIRAQREAVIRLRDEEVINDDVMRRLQQELDLEETRLTPPENE
jgi:CPA1 family monovalent cation:H+ antiporter